jgi:hypothetical protein
LRRQQAQEESEARELSALYGTSCETILALKRSLQSNDELNLSEKDNDNEETELNEENDYDDDEDEDDQNEEIGQEQVKTSRTCLIRTSGKLLFLLL